jgi:predicted RNA-binding Zn ribbon-like protein
MGLESSENFEWTPHRFSGGRLVLDICNTVILRHDAARSVDRLAKPENVAAFPAAAHALCGEAWPLAQLTGGAGHLTALREAADRHFRAMANAVENPLALADLLEACAAALRGQSALAATTARSALRLIGEAPAHRIKICRACGWLFLDQSKNGSRIWCDMAVCGNRSKARRSYANRRHAQ